MTRASLDPIFKEMAAQGQTVFVATGDQGSATPGDVVWPADDPYITAVGGTDLTTNGPGGVVELGDRMERQRRHAFQK